MPYWVIIMAATFGPPNGPADCERISAALNAIMQVQAGPATVRIKCQPYAGPLVPIPQSQLPPPPYARVPVPSVPYTAPPGACDIE